MVFEDYNLNIPASGNNPSSDQGLMLTNTNSIAALLSQDLFGFQQNFGGLHQQSTLMNPGGLVKPTTSQPNSTVLYSRTANSQSQLYANSDGSANQYQLSRFIDASFASFSNNIAYGTPPATFTQTGGWTFLPGGMLKQYGFFGKVGALGSSGQVQFPIAWAAGPQLYSLQLTLYRNSARAISIDNAVPPTTTTFNFLADSGGSDGFYWEAIGK